LGLFSPIITFTLYALITSFKGQGLDAETAFTVTALLGLVTHPANMIMSTIPQVVGSLAAFNRVQQYLLRPQHHDERSILERSQSDQHQATRALVLDKVTIQPHSSRTAILKGVSFAIDRGSIFICCGPVGSGKTVLARAIMGEVPVTEGTVSVSTRHIACCEQSPWLPRGTFKNSICGFSHFVQAWYEDVIRLCCLDEDLLALPNGDETLIGSRGINLSGGQRQRLVRSTCDLS
jgi:ABC-type multidrug transport system fused ATPase/permease subunit